MKATVTLIAFLFAGHLLFAQEMEFPNYGMPSREETDMKQCPFDKDANAVILLHEAFSDYDDEHKLITWHHVRIKILNEKGLEEANVEIPYYRKDDFENINRVNGITINPGANGELIKTKIDKSYVYDQKISALQGKVTFAFSSVKAGSILEYTYQSAMKHYGGLREWVFQDHLPVLLSTYKLTIIPNVEFAYVIQKRSDLDVIVKADNTRGSIYYEMKNIPGLNNEPYIDARSDYIQKVLFQLSGINNSDFGKKKYSSSWNEVIKELLADSDFGSQLTKNIPGTAELIRQVESFSQVDKMKAIYNYVRGNIGWNHYNSKQTIDGLKSVWQKKQGTNGEINLLLINLLKEAGLEVYPLLVSERFHGKVDESYPFLDQFNTVFAYVIINDKKYYLDATDKTASFLLIPYNILNTKALLVNRKMGGLINITDESLEYKDEINNKLVVDENGMITGHVTVKSDGYARSERLNDYKADKGKFMDEYFMQKSGRLSVKDFELLNEANDSVTLEQRASFSYNRVDDGNYDYIPLDLFSGFAENPFLAEERFSNINFGYKRNITIATVVDYPKNYMVDAMPKSIRFTNPEADIIISRKLDNDPANNVLYARLTIEFKKSFYSVDVYPILKELYKKMFDMFKEPVVLKKK